MAKTLRCHQVASRGSDDPAVSAEANAASGNEGDQAWSDHQDDHDFAAGVVRGEPAALEELFSRYAQLVFRVCDRLLDLRADAEDAMAATFLQAWQIRERAVVVEGSLRPWLLAVAVNVARNHRRSQRRRQAAWEREAAGAYEEAQGPEEQVVDRLSAVRDAQIVSAGITQLPEAERLVVELCLLEGMTSAQAAAVLGVPDATVRSRLARTRGRLRQLLQTGEPREHQPAGGHHQVSGGIPSPRGSALDGPVGRTR